MEASLGTEVCVMKPLSIGDNQSSMPPGNSEIQSTTRLLVGQGGGKEALSPSLHLSPSHPPTHPYMFGGHLLCTRHCAADHRSEAEAPLNVSGCSILPASPRAAPPALDASVIPGPLLPGYTHPHWCRAAALTAPLPSRRRSSGG